MLKLKINKRESGLLVLSGLMLGISFPPIPTWFFSLFAFLPFFIVLEKRESLAAINRAAYQMNFVFALITLYWVGGFFQGGSDKFLAIGGTVLLFFNPCVMLIPTTIFYLSKKRFGFDKSIWSFPFFWVTYEYLFSLTDIKFPWLTLGNSVSTVFYFNQIADMIGVYGLSLILLFANVLLFKIYKFYSLNKKINLSFSIVFLLLIIVPIAYSVYRIKTLKLNEKNSINVVLVQPNLDPNKKWEYSSLDTLTDLYFQLSQESVSIKPDLIVWPETALPVYLLNGSYEDIVQKIRTFVNENNVHLITGMPHFQYYPDSAFAPDDAKYSKAGGFYYATYNAMLHFAPNELTIDKYGKINLVPFGEKTPFVELIPLLGEWFKWSVGLTGWNTGKDSINFKLKIENDKVESGGLICFESVFPEFTAKSVQRGAGFLTVVTNDSWYGNTSGPYQHRDFALLRAIENRKYVIRAANGGVSCSINPLGIIEKELPFNTKGNLFVEVYPNDYKTFYTNNPFIVPIISCAISLWIILFNILFFVNRKLNLKPLNQPEANIDSKKEE